MPVADFGKVILEVNPPLSRRHPFVAGDFEAILGKFESLAKVHFLLPIAFRRTLFAHYEKSGGEGFGGILSLLTRVVCVMIALDAIYFLNILHQSVYFLAF